MVVGTVRAKWTKAHKVVWTNFLVPRRVLELTITELSKGSEITQFAKTPFVVGTSLELFVSTNCINSVSEFRMSVNTLELLVTVPILRKITTNWQLVGIV